MDADQIEDIVSSILAETAMEEMRDYLTRGRRFRDADTDTLKQHWVAAFKSWANDLSNRQAVGVVKDSAVELQLRQIEPPYEAVRAETERLAAQVELRERDPEGWDNLQQAIKDILAKRNTDHH